MKVIVLLSTFNGEKYLCDQVASIAKQSFHNWELVIRDDGSTDSTPELLRKFSSRCSDNIKIKQDGLGNVGSVASFSSLVKDAEADYLFFCDQDDVWLPDKIDKTLAAMRVAEDRFGADTPVLVHTDLSVVDCDLQLIAPSLWGYQNLNPHLGSSLNRVMSQNCVTGCTVMINRPLAELAAPFPENAIMHDWWLALIASLFGQVVCLQESTILYRQHGNNSLGAQKWGVKRVIDSMLQSQEVRSTMLRTMRQAQVLLDSYRAKMTSTQIAMVEAYATLPLMTKTARITTVLKYKFLKHGIMRNIGFLLNLVMLERSTP